MSMAVVFVSVSLPGFPRAVTLCYEGRPLSARLSHLHNYGLGGEKRGSAAEPGENSTRPDPRCRHWLPGPDDNQDGLASDQVPVRVAGIVANRLKPSKRFNTQ